MQKLEIIELLNKVREKTNKKQSFIIVGISEGTADHWEFNYSILKKCWSGFKGINTIPSISIPDEWDFIELKLNKILLTYDYSTVKFVENE